MYNSLKGVVYMMLWIWLALIAAFVIIEAATAQLVTIWFAAGSVAALITCFVTDSIPVQIAVFVIVSAIALAVTRPLVRKITASKNQPTNADMYIGSEGIVTEDIHNLEGKGLVKVKGSLWTARTENDADTIEAGTKVTVKRIEGVKLIVENANNN